MNDRPKNHDVVMDSQPTRSADHPQAGAPVAGEALTPQDIVIEKRAALLAGDPLDFWGNGSPKCPHCGADHDISESGAYRLYEEGEHEVRCEACDQDFNVSTRVSFSFDTDHQP